MVSFFRLIVCFVTIRNNFSGLMVIRQYFSVTYKSLILINCAKPLFILMKRLLQNK